MNISPPGGRILLFALAVFLPGLAAGLFLFSDGTRAARVEADQGREALSPDSQFTDEPTGHSSMDMGPEERGPGESEVRRASMGEQVPLLVSGVVLDEDDNPMVGVEVYAMQYLLTREDPDMPFDWPDQEEISFSMLELFGGFERTLRPVRDKDDGEARNRDRALDWDDPGPVLTDSRGYFEFRRDTCADLVQALAQERWTWTSCDSALVPCGTTELTLRVERTGGIRYRIEMDKRNASDGLVVVLKPPASQSLRPWPESSFFEGDGETGGTLFTGSFEARLSKEVVLGGLAEGKYTFQVRPRRDSEEILFSAENVEVLAGAISEDPRLLPIVLHREQRTLEIEVRDRRGKSTNLAVVAAFVHEDLSGSSWRTLRAQGRGKFSLTCPDGRVDLLVGSVQDRILLIENAPANNIVTLALPIEVELELDGSDRLLLPDTVIQARLVPANNGLELAYALTPRPQGFVGLNRGASTRLSTRFEGEHRLELRLALIKSPRSSQGKTLPLDIPDLQSLVQIAGEIRAKIRATIDEDQLEIVGRQLLDSALVGDE